MAEETDQVVDLEAFHQELLNSVNNVRRMVVSWLPRSNDLENFKEYDDSNVNLDSLKTRPERLGLGAKPASSKTSAAALANPNSAEGRIIRTLLGGAQKRKAVEEPETPRASTSGTQLNGKSAVNPADTANDSEDEDSRSKSISSKGKKKADFFHDKPAKHSQSNGIPDGQHTSKKNKKRKRQEAEALLAQSGSTVEGAEDVFARPTLPNGVKQQETPSAPASPNRANGGLSHKQETKVDVNEGSEGEQDDEESIMTETTMTGTLQGSPTPGDGEQRKRKRKNKKKKKKNAQGQEKDGSTVQNSASNGMLFGESILD